MSKSAILCVDDEARILGSLKEQPRRRFGERYLYETAAHADEASIARVRRDAKLHACLHKPWCENEPALVVQPALSGVPS